MIDNIQLKSDYYQVASLPFVVKETEKLFAAYEAKGELVVYESSVIYHVLIAFLKTLSLFQRFCYAQPANLCQIIFNLLQVS